MVRIRMKRFGRRNRPYYRIAVMDQRTRRNGETIEELGQYDPVEPDKSKRFNINEDRVRYWLSVGAQPTETVSSLLRREGIDAKPGTPTA